MTDGQTEEHRAIDIAYSLAYVGKHRFAEAWPMSLVINLAGEGRRVVDHRVRYTQWRCVRGVIFFTHIRAH